MSPLGVSIIERVTFDVYCSRCRRRPDYPIPNRSIAEWWATNHRCEDTVAR